MADEILVGSIDQTIDIFIQDNSQTDGRGLGGLVYNSAGLTCYYRKGALGAWTQLSLVTLALISTPHADGGFKEGDGTNALGVYRLDLSDVMVSTVGVLKIYLKGAVNMAPVVKAIEVVSVNKYDGVRMGLTALPNAAADGAGGLPISDAGGIDLDTILARITANVAIASVQTTIAADVAGLDGDAMRGTDGANTTTPPTAVENRQEMDSNSTGLAAIFNDTNIDIPALISALNDFDPASDQVIVATNNDKTGYALSAAALTAIFTKIFQTAATETYPSVGSTFSLAKFMYELHAILRNSSFTDTTRTGFNLAGSSAFTDEVNSATTPTAIEPVT